MSGPRNADVAIVGTGYSRVGRHLPSSVGSLAAEACLAALADAGLDVEQIDGISNYPNASRLGAGDVDGVDLVTINYMAQALRLRNLRWSCSISQGTLTASIVEAVNAVKAGACNYALVYRAMYNPPGKFGIGNIQVARGNDEFTAPWGLSTYVMMNAMIYSAYLAQYGRARNDLTGFIVANRANASKNEDAVFYRKPIVANDYVNCDIVSEPLGLLDCDMPVDGCGAVLVTSADRAKALRNVPVYVVGSAVGGVRVRNGPRFYYDYFMENSRHLAKNLWRDAGLSASDMDQANIYDGFSYFVPASLEAFGFCGEGEGIDFANEAAPRTKGLVPINTSGGALGMGRLHGSPQLIEGVRQLQGRCGDRQVQGAEISFVQSGHPLAGSAALVLSNVG
jgi:acetyl-CoA acetyltransferase